MSHKQLWAPWRMEYLSEPKKATSGECVFCELPQQTDDRTNLICYRGKLAFVILNRYPYNNGHLMVVPNEHTNDFASVPAPAMQEISELSQHCVRALKEVYDAQGFNLGMNLGLAGGAGIRDHLHMHIVPRWNGDTNFMPVIGDVKSMPQHLLASFDSLATYFRRLP